MSMNCINFEHIHITTMFEYLKCADGSTLGIVNAIVIVYNG